MSEVDPAFWKGRRVFLTGHTGFKGSWLLTWLDMLGAQVTGYALAPPTNPSAFEALGLIERCEHIEGDVRDAAALATALRGADPEILFHLAAQPLVRESYRDPAGTWATNVGGTVNLLQAARECSALRVIVVVTSDKVYLNNGDGRPFTEDDPLGGHDPYSASKAAVELVCDAWRRSFFQSSQPGAHPAILATARAGNVLGGGDWAPDRLIPDAVRAFSESRCVTIRYPDATRPWQHVVEPLRGYLLLAQAAWRHGARFGRGYNFGPREGDIVPVRRVMDEFVRRWGAPARWAMNGAAGGQPHEASLLHLDCARVGAELGWTPRADLATCLDLSVDWYRAFYSGAAHNDLRGLTAAHIQRVAEAA